MTATLQPCVKHSSCMSCGVIIYRTRFNSSMWNTPQAEGTSTYIAPGTIVLALGDAVSYDYFEHEDNRTFSTLRACQTCLTPQGIRFLVWSPARNEPLVYFMNELD